MKKPREFWMDTDILDKALDNCDLGDGYSAKVRHYPHKDMLSQLTHVVEFSALEASQAREKILLDALVEALSLIPDYAPWFRRQIEKYNQAKAGSEG